MAEETGRFEWVGKLARVGLIGVVVILALVIINAVALIVMEIPDLENWTDLTPPILVIIGSLVGLLVAFVLYGLTRAYIEHCHSADSASGRLGQIEALLADQGGAIKELAELASLSDRAKSLVYREHEIEALREAVSHDMVRQDYKSAEALINSLDSQLGYVDEAARLREELETSRKSTLDEKIDAAVKRIQDIVATYDWARAVRESKRVIKLFPDNPRVASLLERIDAARTKHKRELLQAYGEAVRKKDVDQSINLLKELDLYLAPQEAAALADSARGVFKAKLHNLGVQFAIRVTDKSWAQAVEVGQEIINEYPNSRMAHEVRQKLDLMSARAEADKKTDAKNQG